jgi:small conductance mechanosensitive channel
MWIRFLPTLLTTAIAFLTLAAPAVAQVADSTLMRPDAVIADLRKLAAARDSLTALADTTSGTAHDFLEEMIWERQVELDKRVLEIARQVKVEQDRGGDVSAIREALDAGVRVEWPRTLAQLQRRERVMSQLNTASTAATGAERVDVETRATQLSKRLLDMYRSLVESILALERIGVDVSEPRAFLVEKLPLAADALVARVRLAGRDRAGASARLARDGSNADLRNAFEVSDERFNRATTSLTTAIQFMDKLGLETTDLRVVLITASGRVNADVFKWSVFVGLLKYNWQRFIDLLATKSAPWLFQGLLIVLTFLGFRALARLVRYLVRRGVKYSNVSELMRSTIVQLSSNAVYLVGLLVILTQLGVQVAPLLAGLGIAGFIVGFAMQSTLSNFAAGAMILSNRPYDMGDEIEVAGESGVVKKMSLVSTTILTADNQTLIIPNNTIWGGVIRNRTAQPLRRVDLTFGIGYGDDIAKAENVLRAIVDANENVVKDPAPIIKLHQLADSSVNFAVRVWAGKDRYWDVYWDLTRAVKLRFDEAGISIPFPQRELHVKMEKGQLTGPP